MSARIAVAEQMIAHYNARDSGAYVSMMTDDAVESNYGGAPLGVGKDGIRAELDGVFGRFPENRAEIVASHALGEHVVLHERVFRSANATPFDVMSIYSFEGEKVSRVEFVR